MSKPCYSMHQRRLTMIVLLMYDTNGPAGSPRSKGKKDIHRGCIPL